MVHVVVLKATDSQGNFISFTSHFLKVFKGVNNGLEIVNNTAVIFKTINKAWSPFEEEHIIPKV